MVSNQFHALILGYQGLNDGAWHKTRLEFSENFIVAIIDEETYAVNRLFNKFTPSADYHFGGYNPGKIKSSVLFLLTLWIESS